MQKNRYIYLLMLPGILFYVIYAYVPMIGIVIAFENYQPFSDGIIGSMFTSKWVGFSHFTEFFHSYYFVSLMKNTILISALKIVFGFPIPILFALLLNEIKSTKFAKIIQSITSFPYFISWVVVVGLMVNIFSPSSGLLSSLFGEMKVDIMGDTKYFLELVIYSSIWKNFGYGAILYLAAIASIDQELYEAARIDGAGRFKQTLHITLPGIMPTIVILLLFNIGNMMNSDFVQMLNLIGNKAYMYEVGDVIDTYVYRAGLLQSQYSFATAVGLFKAVINTILVVGADRLAKAMGQQGIW